MRKIITLCILTAPIVAAQSGAMNDSERAFLVSQLEQSKKDMLASIDGVTAAQWKFKPAPNVWSVAECAEHIVLAEDYLFGASQQILKTPAVPRPETSNSEQDQKLVGMVKDRSQKATAPEPIVPSGHFETPADAAREFSQRRDRSLAYARTTSDELRVHASKSGLGTMDSYQMLLLMAAHSSRHTAQIREVQSNAGYPKSSAKAHFLVEYSLAHGTLDQLTPAQLATVSEHGAYLRSQLERGRLTWGGRSMDAKNPRGFALVEVASEDEAREFVKSDPAVKAGIFKCTIEPFDEAFRSPKS